ncbi:MAG: MFS transporter [Clostridiales bacterium]|nr:MFS transporter [Clostridiales bacterium]
MKISRRDLSSSYFSSGLQGSALWNRYFCLVILISSAVSFGNFFVGVAFSYWVVDMGGSNGTFGLIHGLYSFLIMLARPVTGWLADNGDRRKTFVFSCVVYVSSMILMLISPYFGLFVALRLIQGAGTGGASTIITTSSYDYIPPSKMDKGIGYISLFGSIIHAVTPALSVGTYNTGGPAALVIWSAAATALGVALSWLVVFRTPKEPKKFSIKEVFNLGVLFEKRSIKPALVMAFSLNLGLGANTFIVLYGRSLGIGNPGWYSTISAAGLLIVRLILDKVRTNEVFPRKRIYLAFATFVANLVCLALCKNIYMFFAAAVLWSVTFGILMPSFTSMVIKAAPADRRGAATSTAGVSSDVGMILGSTLGGFIVDGLGYPALFAVVIAPVILCCIAYRLFIDGKFKSWEEQEVSNAEKTETAR